MTIQFTQEKFTALKRVYTKAVKEGKDSFTFEGGEYLVSYAKYLIEYLSSKFK
jgi:hypothetical protein